MSGNLGRPDPPFERQGESTIRATISREMVRALKKFYGKGPESAKSYFMDDLLLVVMRGGMTTAERTMIDAGHVDAVRGFRQHFENEMTERLIGTVEQLTGRKVINYQSQVMVNPDMAIEIFVFDDTVPGEDDTADEAGVGGTGHSARERKDDVEPAEADGVDPGAKD